MTEPVELSAARSPDRLEPWLQLRGEEGDALRRELLALRDVPSSDLEARLCDLRRSGTVVAVDCRPAAGQGLRAEEDEVPG